VTPNDEITEVTAGDELMGAGVAINKRDGFVLGDLKAPIHAGAFIHLDVLASARSAGAWINGFVFARVGGLESTEDILARTDARVDEAAGTKLLKGCPVKVEPLTL
jgi:hypothetical protein